MLPEDVTLSIGYCGYLCSICPGANSGCPGCKGGGGDEDCHQKRCAADKGLEGCWQCAAFPCAQGCYANPEWRGLTIGLATAVRALGSEAFAVRAEARLGKPADFGAYRGLSPETIVRLLLDE